MKELNWKYIVVVAVIALLAVTGNLKVAVGATADQPSTIVDVPAPGTPQTGATPLLDFLAAIGAAVPTVVSAGALGGFTAGFLDLLKMTGRFTKFDGKTGQIAIVINLLILAAVTIAGVFGYGDKVKTLFEQLGPAIPPLAIGITLLFSSGFVHALLKKVEPKGFSLTAQRQPVPIGNPG